jgi:N-acylneuraminate cytidylyltransferase
LLRFSRSDVKTLALIPARGGSKGVPGKNIRSLLGHPLVAYSIAAARMSEKIDRVIVSTDSEEIAEIARRYGADVPFLRPREFAQDRSPDRDFVLHALAWLQAHDPDAMPDLIVNLRPTTPLRAPPTIDAAITTFAQRGDGSSLRSSHRASESPYKWFRTDADGFYRPLVGDDLGLSELPRQVLEEVFVPNGYVDVLRSAHIQSSPSLYGERILSFITPACREVDTLDDLAYLEFEAERAGRDGLALLAYLSRFC